jgi:hypothetical protein
MTMDIKHHTPARMRTGNLLDATSKPVGSSANQANYFSQKEEYARD